LIPAGYEVIEGVDMATFLPRPMHVVIRWLKKTETKGGVILPQNRQRAHFMKGQLLAVGPQCDPKLQPGLLVEFNGISDKEFLGVQDPVDRDTVFVTRVENVFGLVDRAPEAEGWKGDAELAQAVVGAIPRLDMVGDWLLVRPEAQPDRTAFGLTIPGQARARAQRQQQGLVGKVLSAGGFVDTCRAGDRIAFDATHATQVHLGDHNAEVVLVIDNDAVLGIDEPIEVAA
jgi:co-chaperonin GroES (HSP10)